ncbi:MAG: DUF4254 domain-containing protein [Rubrivivax sp.]|nr:DUF4254 domain-containing protein [Rubrivivax sp.]
MTTTQPLPSAAAVVALHDRLIATAGWPAREPPVPAAPGAAGAIGTDFWRWVQTNHLFNCRLWAEEDLARRTTVAPVEIAANKRAIDGFNQARNDATERIDEILLVALGLVDAASARTDAPRSTVSEGARLNSETAGSMIDRLSILALKVNAMRAQAERQDADDAHRQASAAKLTRLQQQRADLAGCLDALLADAAAGRAYFKVYRQFKMYNDPRFNPVLVAEQAAATAGKRPPRG